MEISENRPAPSATADVPTDGPPSRNGLLAAAVSALAVFVLALFSSVDGPVPGNATADAIRRFVTAEDVSIRVAATTGMLGVTALLVLVSSLTTMARRSRPRSALPELVFAGGLLLAVLHLLDTAANAMVRLLPALLDIDLAATDDATVRGWYDLTGFTHFLGDLQMGPLAVLLLSVSAAAVLPRWLAWVGFGVGVCAALGTVGVTASVDALAPAWFAGLFGWWLWTLAVGIVLGVRYLRSRAHS